MATATGQAINTQTGTAYTLAASDAGKLVTLTNAAAITLTVPGNVFTAVRDWWRQQWSSPICSS